MSSAFVLAVLLLTSCFTQNDGMNKASSFKSFLKDQGGTLGGLYGAQIESVVGLARYDKAIKTDLELAKTIGDAVVPIIAQGLNFIPVVGPLISGIFSSLWTAFSPFLESPNLQQDPIQALQMVMEDYINKSISASEDRMNANLKEKFREVITKTIYAKNNRDSEASRIFSNQIKENQAVSSLRRSIVGVYLTDCDNFLKDTSEGFDYPEFADTLWIPALQSTLTRLSLLTEAIYWGEELGLIPEIVVNFHAETTRDVKRQLKRFKDATAVIREGVKKTRNRYNFNAQEVDGCRMQAMLPYFDTSVYPKGMPKQTSNPNEFESQADSNGVYHAQYFYRPTDYSTQDTIMNCFMGSLVTTTAQEIRVEYFLENDKSYELRLIYRTTDLYSWKGYGFFGLQSFDFGNSIRSEYPQEDRFLLETTIEDSHCEEKKKVTSNGKTTTSYSCYMPERPSGQMYDKSKFIVERVLAGVHTDASKTWTVRAKCSEGCVLFGIEVIQLGTLHSNLKY
ncbi:hypothetical protein Bhyg_08961 [Pseudolycoriella hygida]|uniref:Pesticidal crystal protein domain-containing protein n=1 Tax=Pseudolycoriella hygida TaxID=35572 RepID=A0A9Q0N5L0_9DIPT|nr:hypothetical protein Bhyg_08961 [Pseudolycoriella hygida]